MLRRFRVDRGRLAAHGGGMFVVDAHLDLSMNALEWNRDLTRPIGEIRAREAGRTDLRDRGNGTVCQIGRAHV